MEQSISEWVSHAAKETQDGVMGSGFMPQLGVKKNSCVSANPTDPVSTC